jgi:hypothetical protein
VGRAARVEHAGYRFDGGDLIADAERAYVATPLLERNPDVAPVELLLALAADLGRPVLRLGTTGPVPNHHIGMFVTPLGAGRVAVGDPDAAIRALRTSVALPGDHLLEVGGELLALDLSDERLDRFRRVADELRAAGLEVVSIPLLPTREPFVYLSYNNVLCDRRGGRLHVLLPVYGVAALDAAATSAWEQAGAVVHAIDVSAIFRLGGSVRCLVAPLERG